MSTCYICFQGFLSDETYLAHLSGDQHTSALHAVSEADKEIMFNEAMELDQETGGVEDGR